jgi:hypothetical protein
MWGVIMIQLYPVLRQTMKDNNIKIKELSIIAGMNRIDCILSLWGIRRWKLTEAVKICSFFNCVDAEKMFVRNHFKQ